MAFKMKRPIIKGTKLHKASVAKAKSDSIVSQSRTTADKSLVEAGESLGQSYVPEAIDYSIDMPEIKVSKKKKNKIKEKIKKDDTTVVDQYVDEPVDEGEPGLEPIPESDVDYGEVDYNKEPKSYKNWKRREEERLIKEAEELKKRTEAESKARQQTDTIDSVPITPIPTEDPDIKLSTAEKAPEYKDTVKADKNPRYSIKQPTYDAEGRLTSLGGFTSSPGYDYNHELDQWTYNGFEITESEVPSNHVNARMQESLNSQSESKTDTKDTTEKKEIKKPQVLPDETTITPVEPKPKDFKTSSDYMRARMKYYKQLEKDSPAEKRDNRIWRNAVKGGKVQQNMLKMGYKPPN